MPEQMDKKRIFDVECASRSHHCNLKADAKHCFRHKSCIGVRTSLNSSVLNTILLMRTIVWSKYSRWNAVSPIYVYSWCSNIAIDLQKICEGYPTP
ncbi:hypothetical protein Plhal304r1_c052g0136581 [Plasmopara halstedii]